MILTASISSCVVSQHQQQVAAAVERAKQITVQELNAIIGVRCVELRYVSCSVIIVTNYVNKRIRLLTTNSRLGGGVG